jgi:ketosteroid isomerase-like protein
MTSRVEMEGLLNQLYAARVSGQLNALCATFSAGARFRIAGVSNGKPIAITACGIDQMRPWLAMLVKMFRITNHDIRSMTIDGAQAAVHWRADIHSKITGAVVATELVDLIEVRDLHIAAYTEFFVPC